MTPEGVVKRDIRRELETAGFWFAGAKRPARVTGWAYMPVNNGMGVSGIPDFVGTEAIVITPEMVGMTIGRTFMIEAKAPGKHPTPIQLDRHEEIRTAGGIVLVVDDVSTLREYRRQHG